MGLPVSLKKKQLSHTDPADPWMLANSPRECLSFVNKHIATVFTDPKLIKYRRGRKKKKKKVQESTEFCKKLKESVSPVIANKIN